MPGSSTTRYQVQHLSSLFRVQQELLEKVGATDERAAIPLRTQEDRPEWSAHCTFQFPTRPGMLVGRVPPGMPGPPLPDDRAVVVRRVASPQEGEPPSAEAPPHVIAQLKALGYVD